MNGKVADTASSRASIRTPVKKYFFFLLASLRLLLLPTEFAPSDSSFDLSIVKPNLNLPSYFRV